MIQLSRRQMTGLAIALAAIVVLTLFLAPGGNLQQSGSTYSRSPDGYGAWYAYMEKRGTPLQRWKKPANVLFFPKGEEAKRYTPAKGKLVLPKTPITLLQINTRMESMFANDDWVKQGNVLLLIGMKAPATEAPFTSDVESPIGKVRIDTGRRQSLAPPKDQLEFKKTGRLSDRFGGVVWQEEIGKGRVIYAVTPHLAANAYQDFQANYEFLAKLVTEPGNPIWVDEYLHGYKDPVVNKDGQPEDNLFSYLMRTPLSLVAMQTAILLLLLIWGQNRRLGPPEPLTAPAIDNSAAYIQAMAGVLQKAECSEFVLETVGKAEQLEVQKALGLGITPLPLETLTLAWEQQTSRPAQELQSVLKPAGDRLRLSETDLRQWVDKVKELRQNLPRA